MRLVAYASNRTGPWHIYVRSLTQDNSQDVTPDLDSAQSPVWSPDGQHLAFEATTSGVTSIYTSDPRGGSRVRVTNAESFDGQVSWAPDGKRFAFAGLRGGQWDIYTADAGGGNLARLTNDKAQDWQPAWSPDGARIAFASNRQGASQIYVISATGSGEVMAATNFSVGAVPLKKSPDGNWLAYAGYTGAGEGSNRREIYLEYVPKDKGLVQGRGLIRLTQNGADDTEPAWVWQ
jgi:TolB protein